MRGSQALVPKGVALIILAPVAVALLLASCSRPDQTMVSQLAELQGYSKNGAGAMPNRAELEREVARYQAEVNRTFSATQKLGHLYEMLGIRYLNDKMYGMALRSFQKAIQIHPNDAGLFYVAGLCQGEMAKVEVDSGTRQSLFQRTASYYKNAIDLNPNYQDALYALSVLDVFELNDNAGAEPLLHHLLALDSKNMNALFLLARVYAAQGQAEEAAALYDRIIAGASTEQQRQRARENKQKVLGNAYGQ